MKKIGKYEILQELGRGGMGVVYKAHDALLDRDVALKIILQVALDVPDAKARFYREARMAARLSHDAIAVIYEVGEDEGLLFIVMEYLPGGDLRAAIDNKEPLSLEQKLEYGKQICRGLQYAHSRNVIHRDIKPENIKLIDDGRVKIIDFGIAKPYTSTADNEQTEADRPLTRMGMRIGTPWYMSPEQAKGNPVDKRTDIFSFGVVLYELLTYRKPFTGDDTTVLYKILHEDPPPIELEESGLTDEIQRILSKCLAKDHTERYGDCAEIVRDITALGLGPAPDPHIVALIAEGAALDRAEKYAEAVQKFNEVLDIDSENMQARAFLKRLAQRDKEAFMREVLAGNVINKIITHFQILDKIGGGGMGVVYRAMDLSLKRLVALKFLMPDLVRDPSAKKRFLKEAQAASALDHPNICTIHEIGETPEGLLFICMAFYGGENLHTRISRGPLAVTDALDIAIRVGRGLAKAHENGIVHRDIKPANIIITGDGEVKIVDFGLAKLSGGTQITRVGSRMGTLPYMSPEQIRGVDVDFHTDIWSLAVLLFQSLTGSLPFKRDYEAAMLYAIVTDAAPRASSQRQDLPGELDPIIARGLKKDPRERYASAQAMVEELITIRNQIAQTGDTRIIPEEESRASLKGNAELRGRVTTPREDHTLWENVPGDDGAGAKQANPELTAAASRRTLDADQANLIAQRALTNPDRKKRGGIPTVSSRSSGGPGGRPIPKAFWWVLGGVALLGIGVVVFVMLPKSPPAQVVTQQTPPPVDSSGTVEAARLVMANEQKHASEADAPNLGKDTYSKALGAEHDGEDLLSRKSFGAARQRFEEAARLFKKSSEEAKTGPGAVNESLALLRKNVSAAWEEMHRARIDAEKSEGRTLARDLFDKALSSEQEGDKGRRSEERAVLLSTTSKYGQARDEYVEAASLARHRHEADAAKGSMVLAKGNVPGNDADRRANSAYKEAMDDESSGTGLYSSGDYAGASAAFAKSKNLYVEAAKGVASALAARVPSPPAEARGPAKVDPAKKEAEDRESALREIKGLIEQYKKCVEDGNLPGLTSLLNLSQEEQKAWASLFKMSDKKVTIENLAIQPDHGRAHATFTEKLSFENADDPDKPYPRDWTLDFNSGRWRVVSHK